MLLTMKNLTMNWILNHRTAYYYKAMSKSKNLINALVEFLKSNFHEGIEHVLIRITFFSRPESSFAGS